MFGIWIIHKSSLGSREVTHTKFGPDRFNRFDVYRLDPNKVYKDGYGTEN